MSLKALPLGHMNLGFDGSRAFAEKKTGTENYSYNLLKALAKIDQKNKYLVFLRPGVKLEKLPGNFTFKTINWLRLWTQGGLGLETFKSKIDVLFVPAHTVPIIKKPGLKTVVTVHDLGSEYLPQMHQFKQRAYLGLMQKYQLKTATKIIAVSSATKNDLVSRIGLDAKNIRVIHEGYNKDLFSTRSGSAFGRKTDTEVYTLMPYFLFVGTVQPRKNLERVIRAFAAFHLRRGLKLVIAGSKGWMSDEIYELPKKLGIEERVKFLGYVPDEKLPALYSNAEAFLFPSLFEGFGLPILEAQACGCPVITSNISSMPEVAGEGAILVDPYSVDDIVRGMERIMNHELRIKLVKQGFENVKRFSWEKAAKETLELLEDVGR